ncbi:MAG: fatty acid desaturase [Anaerolineae bacterium]
MSVSRRPGLGPFIAIGVIVVWATSLVLLLGRASDGLPVVLWPLGTLWLTFLYTGMFMTAHDAIHGSIWRGRREINAWVGRGILFLYAFFPYAQVREQHFLHHRFPGSSQDPDYTMACIPASRAGTCTSCATI